MIRRLHAKAGGIVLGFAALASLTAAAQGVVYVTRSEMEAYVWGVLITAGAGTVLVGAGLLAWIMGRDRALQQASIDLIISAADKLSTQVEHAVEALTTHNSDPNAHPKWDGRDRRR